MIHSFLLIGQSNAAGRGSMADAEPLDTCCGKLQVARNGLWLKMFRPVNPDRSFSGTCLAESFAKAYSESHPDVQVGIIPCADGGTTVEQWQPGEVLFDNAVNCARLAMRSSRLVGVLWHQGEGDCRIDRYPFYEGRLQNVIRGLRKALDLPDLPVLVGGLGDFLKYREGADHLENYPHINAALQSIASQDDHCAFVSATGLTAKHDNLHFNHTSLMEFGYRYFDAFKALPCYESTLTDMEIGENTERTAMEQL